MDRATSLTSTRPPDFTLTYVKSQFIMEIVETKYIHKCYHFGTNDVAPGLSGFRPNVGRTAGVWHSAYMVGSFASGALLF